MAPKVEDQPIKRILAENQKHNMKHVNSQAGDIACASDKEDLGIDTID